MGEITSESGWTVLWLMRSVHMKRTKADLPLLPDFLVHHALSEARVIKDSIAFENEFEVLLKRLDQDRFGLDVEFVQETIE